MTPSPTLRFLGAAGTVTGSKFLIDVGDAKVLVDAGLFQGPKHLRELNRADIGVDPSDIDAVVITHAHLDHVGYLPVLTRNGFSGPIFATAQTKELAAIVLADSGRLQEEEAEYANRKGYSKHHPAEPLYTEADAVAAAARMTAITTDSDVAIAGNMTAHFRRAGHILGSATITIRLPNNRTILFSGDLGRPVHPLLQPPADPPDVDIMLIESTYGNRAHQSEDVSVQRLAEIIGRTHQRRGVVVIPAFAVDRTEVVLYRLAQLQKRGQIPHLPVHVDSPMALSALHVYRRAIAAGDPELRVESLRDDPFATLDLHESTSVAQSRSLNDISSAIIIASSGMATGGRVLHHLANRLPDSRNAVILVGYQSPGTRGAQLADGATVVKMLGQSVPVRAEVAMIGGFSVHADGDELIAWAGRTTRPPDCTYVIHGEADSAAAVRGRLEKELHRVAAVPALNERVRLDSVK